MNKTEMIQLFAQIAGGVLLPVGTASAVAPLVKALTETPGVEADDAQLALLDRDYQARIDRRLNDATIGHDGH